MSTISFVSHGSFKKTNRFIERALEVVKHGDLDRFGRAGVEALRHNTPVDTGRTAESWDYRIIREKDQVRIEWTNSNIVNGIPIAVLLQYGHATRNGGWVEGRDYINPAIRPIFDQIANDAWKELRGK